MILDPILLIAAKNPTLLGLNAFVYLAELGEHTPYAIWYEGHLDELIDPPTFDVAASSQAQELTEASFR